MFNRPANVQHYRFEDTIVWERWHFWRSEVNIDYRQMQYITVFFTHIPCPSSNYRSLESTLVVPVQLNSSAPSPQSTHPSHCSKSWRHWRVEGTAHVYSLGRHSKWWKVNNNILANNCGTRAEFSCNFNWLQPDHTNKLQPKVNKRYQLEIVSPALERDAGARV